MTCTVDILGKTHDFETFGTKNRNLRLQKDPVERFGGQEEFLGRVSFDAETMIALRTLYNRNHSDRAGRIPNLDVNEAGALERSLIFSTTGSSTRKTLSSYGNQSKSRVLDS